MNQIQEFLACFRIIAEYAQHGRCHRFAVDFLYTTHYHAHVTALLCIPMKMNNNITLEMIYFVILEMTTTYTPSTTTATPAGCTAWVTATAICLVSRSCTCKRREKISTILQLTNARKLISESEYHIYADIDKYKMMRIICENVMCKVFWNFNILILCFWSWFWPFGR